MRAQIAAFLAVSSLALACSGAPPASGESLATAESPEVWSTTDDPASFGGALERKLDSLPTTGEAAAIPWAGNYWPTFADNINFRWNGPNTDSPAKKYEKAFGGVGVEDAVSTLYGIDSQANATECTTDAACNSALLEVCAKRVGRATGRCVVTWSGICHAWAPASILLPEPKTEVVKNGVVFNVQDLKALLSLAHNRSTAKYVSLRCNKNDSSGAITYDASGRPVDADRECRDTNAGTFHLLLANYLGVQKRSFIEDRRMDSEVWNQPLRGYKVTSKTALTWQEANDLLGVTATGGSTVTKVGSVARGVWAHQGSFAVTPGSTYRVIMTGTGDADLYVRYGAQPTASAYDCRPYEGTSDEICSGTVPAGVTRMFVSANGYEASSTFSMDVTTGAVRPSAYAFNSAAVSFARVKADVKYIGESPASTDGNLSSQIDTFTHVDSYDYVLELDASGKIVGGEWLGDSRRAHPDFLWLPLGVASESVASGKISYAEVRALVMESAAGTISNPVAPTTVNQSGTVTSGEMREFGPFNVAAGTTLSATLTGTNDADLYVRSGSAPTLSSYDCRPYVDGSSETCSASGPARVFVSVNGYAASSDFQLRVTYTPAN